MAKAKTPKAEEFYNRAAAAEVKGYYRLARRLYLKAAKAGYKSPTSGKDMATVKAKDMDAKVKKGMGRGKGTQYAKSQQNRAVAATGDKKEPTQQRVSRRVQKGTLSKDFKTGKITYTDANGKKADVTSAKAKEGDFKDYIKKYGSRSLNRAETKYQADLKTAQMQMGYDLTR